MINVSRSIWAVSHPRHHVRVERGAARVRRDPAGGRERGEDRQAAPAPGEDVRGRVGLPADPVQAGAHRRVHRSDFHLQLRRQMLRGQHEQGQVGGCFAIVSEF